MRTSLNSALNVRITKSKLTAFKRRCKSVGKTHSEVLREMVEAFTDGRLRIEMTEKQKQAHQEIHHVD